MQHIGRRNFVSLAGASALCAVGAPNIREARADNHAVIRRGYTDCRFGQLHYIRGVPSSGVTNKPTLVMLHQNPSSSVEYEPLIREMALDREVIAFDTPGNGMSDWPPAPMDIAGYAAAFSDGLDSLNLGVESAVDVFGFHTGSFLTAELAIARPDKVGRIALSGIPYRTPAERQDRLDAIDSRPRLTEDGKDIMGQLQRLWAFVVTSRDQRVPLERAAEVFVEKAKPLDRYWWPYRGVWTYDVEKRFPLITQPTLVIQPHETLLEYTKRAVEFIADARLVELPDLKRDVFDVGADQYAKVMRDFLV